MTDMTDQPFYMVGTLHCTHEPVALAVTPTATGWRCRSSVRGALCHDYVSRESLGKVRTWVERDLQYNGCEFTQDREEMRARLATLVAASDDGSLGFLAPDPQLAPDAAAEQVLQHLERGW